MTAPVMPAAGARWCTTLTPGDAVDRRRHDTFAAAWARVYACQQADGGPPAERLTIWFDNRDLTGWHSYRVVDLRTQERAA